LPEEVAAVVVVAAAVVVVERGDGRTRIGRGLSSGRIP